MKPEIRPFLYIGLICLVVRVLYWNEHVASAFFSIPILDEKYYDQFARMLISGQDLSNLAGFRPILYPFFLSVIYRIGEGFSIALAVFVQHMLGAATSIIVALLSARLFNSRRAGIFSGIIYIFAAPPLFFEGELLIASFLTFLITLNLYLHAWACEKNQRFQIAPWLACGAMTALSAQARANMLIFSAVYFVLSFLFFREQRRVSAKSPQDEDGRVSASAPLFGIVGTLVVLLIFGVINANQTGNFYIVPGAGGINFFAGNNRAADGMTPRQAKSVTYKEEYHDSMQVFAMEAYHDAMKAAGKEPTDNISEVSRYWRQHAFKEIQADPARWLKLMAKKSWILLWNYEVPNNKSLSFIQEQESFLLRILPTHWFILLALAPIGIWSAWRVGERYLLLILLCFIVLYSASIVMFFVNARFRIPLWPPMAILAGGGIYAYWLTFQRKDFKRILIYSAVIVGISFLSLINWFGIEKPSYARDYYFRSKAYYVRGQYGKALTDINQNLKLDPNNCDAMLHYGNVLFALNKYSLAREVYERVSGIEPYEPRVWNNLGAAYDSLKNYGKAYQAYTTALKLDNSHRSTLLNLALLELRAGLFDSAKERIARLESLKKDEEDLVLICAKAVLEKAQNHPAAAHVLEKKAYAIDSNAAHKVFSLLSNNPIDPTQLADN